MSRSRWTRTGSCAATARCSRSPTPRRRSTLPDGPGVVVAFKDIEEQRGGRAGAARARGDPREGRAAGLGHRPARPLPLRQSGGARRARLRGALRAQGQARARRRSTTSTPTASPFPEEDCPLVRARAARARRSQDREDWLVRKDGSIVRDRVLVGAVRPARRAGLGDRVHRRRGAARAPSRRRASATSPQARAAELRVARRRIIEAADAARAQLERDLHDGAQQQFVSALLRLRMAERKLSVGSRAAAASCATTRIELDGGGVDRAAPSSPPGSTRRSSPTAGSGRRCTRSRPGCRSGLRASRRRTVRLPAPVEASVYFFVSEALTNVVKHAQARRGDRPRRAPGTVR